MIPTKVLGLTGGVGACMTPEDVGAPVGVEVVRRRGADPDGLLHAWRGIVVGVAGLIGVERAGARPREAHNARGDRAHRRARRRHGDRHREPGRRGRRGRVGRSALARAARRRGSSGPGPASGCP